MRTTCLCLKEYIQLALEVDGTYYFFCDPLKITCFPILLSKLPVLLIFNPLSTNPTKWSNTLKQFVGSLPTTCFLSN